MLISDDVIEVKLNEKRFYFTFFNNNQSYLISELFEIIETLPSTNIVSAPLLVFNEYIGDNQVKNEKVKKAFKIIDALREINKELLERLVEVNLNDNRDLILMFSQLNAPVYLKRDNLIKELLTLNELMKINNPNIIDENTKYIDLRFNNQIIIG
jgi:hypothetical protein